MALRIRKLRLSVSTADGEFGTRVDLDDGLVVLRADNSSGKSTCIQAIIYALGLEGMLSAAHEVPLAHAMTDAILDPGTGLEVDVIESFVAIEVTNGDGKSLSIRRYAKHQTVSTGLISVWAHETGSEASAGTKTDYFVRRPGSATREAGFHTLLANFIGWELPSVPTFDEDRKPLYLETLFPLFVIEQKRGWSGIQAQVPTQFRIRDVRRRALEFVLRLSSAERIAQLEELQRQARLASIEWSERRSQLDGRVRSSGAVLQHFPQRPPATWPADPSPAILIAGSDRWLSLDEEIEASERLLSSLSNQPTPKAGSQRPDLHVQLTESERGLRRTLALAARESQELAIEEAQLADADSRLRQLDEDLRRHQDLQQIRRMGGEGVAPLLSHDCPTCHQTLPDSLVDELTAPRVMTLEESINFIGQEKNLFRDLRADSERVVAAKRARLDALGSSINAHRSQIVAIRNSLVAPDGSPSEAEVERKVATRTRVAQLADLRVAFATAMEELAGLWSSWSQITEEIKRLRAIDASQLDEPKRIALEADVRTKLDEYRIGSVAPEAISISENSWLPSHEGFDLSFDLSASDLVRVVWAYLLSLLDLSRNFDLNHPGLLVLDEPRQQMTSRESFAAFIRSAGTSGAFEQQVIVATSEDLDPLNEMLGDAPAQVVDFGSGKILRRVVEGGATD